MTIKTLVGVAVAVSGAIAYRELLRQPILTWGAGATGDEVKARLPGDELLDGSTRLISRNRFRLPRLRDQIGMIPMEPGSLVMERKMLHGTERRAEKLASEQREVTRA